MKASALIAEESETTLVNRLAEQPNNRKTFLALARYYEDAGNQESARSLYDGIVPQSIIASFGLENIASKSSVDLPDCRRLSWYQPECIKLSPPVNDDPARNTVFNRDSASSPPEWVDILENAVLMYNGTDVLYMDKDSTRVANHSSRNSYLLYNLIEKGAPAKILSGLSIMLSARNSGNFYHWHYDVLPVLGMIEAAGIPLSDISNILITQKEQSFQREMLDLLGIKPHQIIVIDADNVPVHCENLLMVKIHNRMGMAQSRRHLDWIRTKFLRFSLNDGQTQNKKIAIRRAQRCYTQDGEVFGYLKRSGYEIIQPEQLDYIEQLTMFASASHVVSPHGAALANLVYCEPGTVVHEFYGEHIHPCFWAISSAMGHTYNSYNCSALTDGDMSNDRKGLPQRRDQDINLELTTLQRLDNL